MRNSMKPKDLSRIIRHCLGNSWVLTIGALVARDQLREKLARDRENRIADRVIEKLEARDEQKMQETLNKLEEWSTN